MKTYLSTLIILLASLLVGCNESPTAATYSEPVSQYVVQSSSSIEDDTTQSSSSQTQYVTEFGFVPTGYNTDAITGSNSTQAYIRMNELYTVKLILTLGTQPRSETELLEWLDSNIATEESALQDTVINHIRSDLDEASASLRFYTRDDGKFIFIYTEAYNDGIGLK